MKFARSPLCARHPTLLVAVLFAAAPLSAQTVVAGATTPDSGTPIVMSPFQVSEDNRGYQALNTISGTRLNSKLDDLGAAISVVTKQQLIDTAAVDINDIFLYEANTEGTENYTAFTTNRDGYVNDDIQGDPQTANRIRGMSSANIAIANFTSNPKVPIDPYNIDAVEISRGPNSNIFGLGTGGGTVNIVPSSANLTRDFNAVTGRVDDRGSLRGTLDLNRTLWKDQLALRLSAMAEDKEFERKPSYDRVRRLQLAVTAQPFSRTTIRATAELYRDRAQRPNYLTPMETITAWKSFGSPTWDPTTLMVHYPDGRASGPFPQKSDRSLPLGLQAVGNNVYNRTSLYIEPDGSVGYWSVNRTGKVATPLTRNTDTRLIQTGTELDRERDTYPLFFDPAISDSSLYDWSSVNYVAPNFRRDTANTYHAELEQFFIDNPRHLLAARLGWFRQEFERYDRAMISANDTVLYVDVNEKRLDGTPNPYFLRPYVAGSWPIVLREPENSETRSADLVYQFRPAASRDRVQWFGRQQINFHGEQRLENDTNYRYRDYVVSNEPWINPADRTVSTQTLFQYYLGDNHGQNVDYAPSTRGNLSGTYPFHWYNGVTKQWVTEDSTLGEAAINGTNRNEEEIRTFNVTYQGFFWDDRLVPTLGFRRDVQRGRRSTGDAVDPNTGWITYAALRDFSHSPWIEQAGNTTTAGMVLKATPWLRLFYNRSDSFDPEGIQYNVFEELMPNPTSKGEDYGIGLNLLGGKLNVRINRYDTTQFNSRKSEIGTVGSRIHRLEGVRQPYAESFFPWAQQVAQERFIKQGINPTSDQLFKAAADIMQLSPDFLKATASNGAVGVPADVESKGYEIEAVYNPRPNWRFKFNAAEQEAIDSNIGDTITNYLAQRLAVWTTAKDDQGNRWWDANNGAARTRYLSDILAPYSFEVANVGKPRSQVRKWRANLLSNYEFESGPLKNFTVGGAVRWEDKAAIGYYGRPPNADGEILELDPDRPIYDRARYHFDFDVAYRFRFARDRFRGRVQLNIRDAFEGGRLQAVAVNPDGAPYAYRIIDPRQFILSIALDL
jgi:outer membrane receptor protein involved in Fe transport